LSNNIIKKADPEKGNIYWNYFRFLAPYFTTLIVLLAIFYFFPLKNKLFMFIFFAFFVIFSAVLLLSSGKFIEFAFWLFYLPVYCLSLLLYFFLYEKDKK